MNIQRGKEYADPYAILIAEMMLRRTTATTVARVYPIFMSRFSSLQKLARARVTTIESIITPLGLQKERSKHLRDVANYLVKENDSKVPTTMDELVHLPGIGLYVASAVLNFAFDESVSLVDGNVLHLISRVFGVAFNGPDDPNAWKFMDNFDLNISSKFFYWSIIDLVALICLRRMPRCKICPLSDICNWFTTYVNWISSLDPVF